MALKAFARSFSARIRVGKIGATMMLLRGHNNFLEPFVKCVFDTDKQFVLQIINPYLNKDITIADRIMWINLIGCVGLDAFAGDLFTKVAALVFMIVFDIVGVRVSYDQGRIFVTPINRLK